MAISNKISLASTFLILISLQLPGAVFSQSIPFETIAQGETSYFSYGNPDFLGADMVVRDEPTWVWFWTQHTFSLSSLPPLPKINFNKDMVLVVLLGYQTSGGGPSIEISSIDEIGQIGTGRSGNAEFSKGIRAFVSETRGPGALEVITNPYHLVRTKKSISVLFQHQPPGKRCAGNSDCLESEYCGKGPGNCNESGICQSKPQVCAQIYAPSCGCDGKTYGNECAAALEGISLAHEGPCGEKSPCMKNEECGSKEFCLFPKGICSGPGVCTPKPELCPNVLSSALRL